MSWFPSRSHRPPALCSLIAALALPVTSPLAVAQAPPATVGDECFGFTFGHWTPPLDMEAAGHAAPRANAPTLLTADGRAWAARIGTGRDTTLVLFPVWWPAGVTLNFPSGMNSARDSARGTATALVADGRMEPPRAPVLLRRVPCTAPAHAPPPRPTVR